MKGRDKEKCQKSDITRQWRQTSNSLKDFVFLMKGVFLDLG